MSNQNDWIGEPPPVNSIEGKKAAEALIKRLPPARRLVFDAVKAAGPRGTYGLALAEALNKPRDAITPRLHELWMKDNLIMPVPDAHNAEKVFRAVYL